MWVGEQRECRDCGSSFHWPADQQRVYADRNFEPPKRCPTCRQIRRSLRDVTDQTRVTPGPAVRA